MNYLVLQIAKPALGRHGLEHKEFPVCHLHLKPGIHMQRGYTHDTCAYCETEMTNQFHQLLSNNKWLAELNSAYHVYISGPMTGIPEFNRPAFARMAHALKLRGAKYFNPGDNPYEWNYAQNMRHDIKNLLEVNRVVMLKGWEKSKGAMIEHTIATTLEIPIFYEIQ